MTVKTIFTLDRIGWDFENSENPCQGVTEASEQRGMRSTQVELWKGAKASQETAKLVSTVTFLYSSIILPYAIKHQEKKGAYFLTIIGLASALSRIVAGRASSKATEQMEAWAMPVSSRAAAKVFWDHIDKIPNKGMSTERYIWLLFKDMKSSPPQEEGVSQMRSLLNLFKSCFWKKST